MEELDIELTIGESVIVGDRLITVLDVEGDEVTFRVERLVADELDTELFVPAERTPVRPR